MSVTWEQVSARQGRNDLPYHLGMAVLVEEVITDETEIAKGIADAWVMAEWPIRGMEPSMWRMLFDKVGFLDDGVMDTNPPDSIVVYRGCVVGQERGMSWTDDLEKAIWFAERFGVTFGETKVYTMTATPASILGHFTRRGESEWVLDPEQILEDDIQEL